MTELNPIISVCMITYNHEAFISEAIEGVLMQKTSFPFELIISDDCSTDKTREICLKYKSKYPDIIRLLLPESNLGMTKNFIETIKSATGEYIAICEGDDYWTDQLKLQKQIDFMEVNTEYSVCFHRYKIFDNESGEIRNDGCGYLFENNTLQGISIDTIDFLRSWITQPLTMFFRKCSFNIEVTNKYTYFRDIHLIYHILQSGKGYLFAFEGGNYREHNGGIHSKQSLQNQCKTGLDVAREIYIVNRTSPLKENYFKTLQWVISTYSTNRYETTQLIIYIFVHLYYSKNFKRFLKNIRLLTRNYITRRVYEISTN